MAVTGDAALAATKQATIAAIAQRLLVSEAILAPSIRDVSMFAKKGDKSITFPKHGSFTVENRASGAAATIQNLQFAGDTMLLDKRATIAWLIDSHDELESQLNVREEYIKTAAKDHAVYVDGQIITELEAVADAGTVTLGDITKDIFLEMRTKLLTRKAMRNELYFACGPDQEEILLGIPQFVEADKYGAAVIPNGVLGRLYGVNVLVTPEIGAQTYYMYERSACAIGFQKAPMFDTRKAPEYGTGSMLEVLDQKFGVQGLHIELQGAPAGKSALVVKDAN